MGSRRDHSGVEKEIFFYWFHQNMMFLLSQLSLRD